MGVWVAGAAALGRASGLLGLMIFGVGGDVGAGFVFSCRVPGADASWTGFAEDFSGAFVGIWYSGDTGFVSRKRSIWP